MQKSMEWREFKNTNSIFIYDKFKLPRFEGNLSQNNISLDMLWSKNERPTQTNELAFFNSYISKLPLKAELVNIRFLANFGILNNVKEGIFSKLIRLLISLFANILYLKTIKAKHFGNPSNITSHQKQVCL